MVKVNVIDAEGKIIGYVEYNQNLDSCIDEAPGRHTGLSRLRKSGKYVLIHGSEWAGETNHAEVIEDEEAFNLIYSSGNLDLLENFKDLKRFAEGLDTDEDPEAKTTIQVSKALQKKLSDLKMSPDETYDKVIERYLGNV